MNQSTPKGSTRPRRNAHQQVDAEPEQVEIGERHDLAIEEGAPAEADEARYEQPREQEEAGHAELFRPGDQRVDPAALPVGEFESACHMHQHDQDDADALARIDPADAPGRAMSWCSRFSHDADSFDRSLAHSACRM